MYLNELPELVLIEILNNLPLTQAIRFKRTCKLWNFLINQRLRNESELILFVDLPCQDYLTWGYNDKEIDSNHSLTIDTRLFLNENLDNYLFKYKTKKLFVYGFEMNQNYFDKLFIVLDQLKDVLEHLEINGNINYRMPIKKSIKFKPLKTLKLEYANLGSKKFKLEFENLESLTTFDMSLNNGMYERIKNLKFLHLNFLYNIDKIDFKFLNLQVLCITSPNARCPLALFPVLKELHIYEYSFDYHFNIFIEDLDYYLEQKRVHNRDDLKIYAKGYEYSLSSASKLESQEFFSSAYFNYVNENFFEYYKDHHVEYKCLNFFDWIIKLNDRLINTLESMDKALSKGILRRIRRCEINKRVESLNKTRLKFVACERIRFFDTFGHFDTKRAPFIFPYLKELNFARHANIELDENHIKVDDQDFSFIANFKSLKKVEFKNIKPSFTAFKNIIDNCVKCDYFDRGFFGNFRFMTYSYAKEVDFKYENRRFYLVSSLINNPQEFMCKEAFLKYLQDEHILDD